MFKPKSWQLLMKTKNEELNTIPINEELEIEKNKLHPVSRRDMRSLAFHFVYAADRSNYEPDINTIIENFKQGFNLSVDNEALAVIMAKGTVNNRDELDEKIKPLLKHWKFERLGCCTRLILRLAIWELQQPDTISNIVINEAIELAKAFAEKDAYKFINGILDEACKTYKFASCLKNQKLKEVEKADGSNKTKEYTGKQ